MMLNAHRHEVLKSIGPLKVHVVATFSNELSGSI